MIASSQSKEELEAVLKRETELKADEIERIVAIKQQVLDNQKELRKETIKKIHERLVRNRQLNLESVFCSRASTFDQLVLNPVYYPFDVHTVNKEISNRIFSDFEMISDELSNYPDLMLQLEGSCDYKGSNKYNKALGDRRWSGVMPLLTSLGYSKNNIRGISKGEECPTPKKDDDEVWRSENRRTDFVWVLK
jgi:outer membrane protein OmpA-like peptidoglycan-associated protein